MQLSGAAAAAAAAAAHLKCPVRTGPAMREGREKHSAGGLVHQPLNARGSAQSLPVCSQASWQSEQAQHTVCPAFASCTCRKACCSRLSGMVYMCSERSSLTSPDAREAWTGALQMRKCAVEQPSRPPRAPSMRQTIRAAPQRCAAPWLYCRGVRLGPDSARPLAAACQLTPCRLRGPVLAGCAGCRSQHSQCLPGKQQKPRHTERQPPRVC